MARQTHDVSTITGKFLYCIFVESKQREPMDRRIPRIYHLDRHLLIIFQYESFLYITGCTKSGEWRKMRT